MELKPGYRQTEVGIIPVDWDVDYIENIGHVATGSKNTQDRIEDGEYPFFVRSQSIERINTYSFDGEAVLTAGDGVGTGKVFHYINGKFDVHQRVYRISDFSPRVNGHFFYLYFSRNFYNRIMQMTAKSSVDSVRRNMITRMMVPLPTIKGEQDAISQAIRDADALLDGLDRLIAKKRDLKQAAMQQLLTGKTRLSGFEGEWEHRSLIEIAEFQKSNFEDGDWIEAEHITDRGIRLIQTGNIGIGSFVEKDVRKYIYEESFIKLRCKELRVGDILICRLAEPAGRSCIFPNIGEERVITSVDVTIFRIREEAANPRFIVQYCSTENWFKSVLDNVGGTTHKRISRAALGKLLIPFPSIKEQTAIATVLSDMDDEIAAIEQRRAKTKDIKQAMMQELLTGKTRLVTPRGSNV